jgi:hypothetical protein
MNSLLVQTVTVGPGALFPGRKQKVSKFEKYREVWEWLGER